MSKLLKLRANRSVRIKTLERFSDNWCVDHIRKLVIYNLVDLSAIVRRAKFSNLTHLYIPDIFPLRNHKKYGYNAKNYIGLIRGIFAQTTGTELTLVWDFDCGKEINEWL